MKKSSQFFYRFEKILFGWSSFARKHLIASVMGVSFWYLSALAKVLILSVGINFKTISIQKVNKKAKLTTNMR